jgi:hypothetical protein
VGEALGFVTVDAESQSFSPFPSRRDLDEPAVLAHCAGMFGLNLICGICREIIG